MLNPKPYSLEYSQRLPEPTLDNDEFVSLSSLLLANRSGQAIVAGLDNDSVSWSCFQRDVLGLAATLKTSSYMKWALCFDDSYYFAVALFAAAHAGKEIVLPGNHQPSALDELQAHFDALLHDRQELLGFTCPQLALPYDAQQPAPSFQLAPLQPGMVKITLFTSGSSGKAKAIAKTLVQLEAEITQLEANWGSQLKASQVVSTVSHQHIYGLLFRVLWPLCSGRVFARRDLIYPEQVTAKAALDTALITSPALLKRLAGEETGDSYRAVFSSGGPLSESAAHDALKILGHLPIEVFGSTETGGIAFRQQVAATTPWALFDVIDASLNAEGCLKVRSPFVDQENDYQTTDQCQFVGDRDFILLGRTDRVVKIEEKRISLTEIERRLCQLTWIEEAAVLTLEQGGRIVISAVVTLTDDGDRHLQACGKGKFWIELRQQLRRWIEPVGIPRRFRFVDEIPLNSQGKRLVRELEALFAQD